MNPYKFHINFGIYTYFDVENKDKDPKFKVQVIMSEYQNLKAFLQEATFFFY